MNTIQVSLSAEQVRIAKDYARQRNEGAKADGKKDAHGASWSDDYKHHLTGSLAEVIFFAGMGIDEPVLTVDTYKSEPDVAPGLIASFPLGAEIRGRNASRTYPTQLIIREDDDPTMPYVLVVVDEDQSGGTIWGWINGQEAMDHSEWYFSPNNRPAAWFVPFEALRPVTP